MRGYLDWINLGGKVYPKLQTNKKGSRSRRFTAFCYLTIDNSSGILLDGVTEIGRPMQILEAWNQDSQGFYEL